MRHESFFFKSLQEKEELDNKYKISTIEKDIDEIPEVLLDVDDDELDLLKDDFGSIMNPTHNF